MERELAGISALMDIKSATTKRTYRRDIITRAEKWLHKYDGQPINDIVLSKLIKREDEVNRSIKLHDAL